MFNTLYSHSTNHNHTHAWQNVLYIQNSAEFLQRIKNIDWTQLQHKWSQQKRGRGAAMHPIKVLNQAIAKVLKLMFVSFASLEKSHFFLANTTTSLCFYTLNRVEKGVEGNQRAEQRGKNKDFRCLLSPAGRCWLCEAQTEEISSDHLLIFTLNSPLRCLCPEEGHSVETKE